MSASPSPDDITRRLGLAPHPEGGFSKETYRSPEVITQSSLPQRFGGDRCLSTAIYYLLRQGQKSKLHRIHSDEMWHFYLGDPLIVAGIDESGQPYEIVLGQDIGAGQRVQYTVKAGHWFGARPSPGSKYSFVGCTVAPGFDFADFELGDKSQLLLKFPAASAIIHQYCD